MSKTDWLNNLCVLEVSFVNTYIANTADYPMKNHARHHHGFLYTLKGTETYNFADKKISTGPDTIIYIPKGEKYTIDFKDEESIVIAIDFEALPGTTTRPFCVKMENTTDIKAYFSDAEKTWIRKKPNYPAMCKSYIYRVISLLINHEVYYSNSDGYNKISAAVEYLHKHYLENTFRIGKLFEMSDISPRYFETLFFKEFKTTPKEYVTSLKIAQAKELLKSEKYSVGEVATQLGFGDIYHFSKIFKAKTGYTPTDYTAGDR